MNLLEFKNIYFLGIGGIGMSALARWFKAQGFWVGGYDKTETTLTQQLFEEGIDIHYDNKLGRIPSEVYQKRETLVVRTPAVPKENFELQYFENERYIILKRSEVLGLITENLITIAVSGTHGKTTTSCFIAHILKQAGANVSAILGGISANYNSNLLIGKPTEKIDKMPDVPIYGKHLCVVEADEYDRSFLTLQPDIAIVTSMDADHLDIYDNHEELKKSFSDFINQIKVKGHLIIKNGLDFTLKGNKLVYIHIYNSVSEQDLNQTIDTPFSAKNITIVDGFFRFDFFTKTNVIKDIKLQVPGFHNVENAVAAINACILLEVPEEIIKSGLETFRGVKRRFEYIINTKNLVFIDDYAHHPTEIEAFLSSVKALYPNKKLTCIFQPHLFSRTRDFADGFSKSLSIADEVILMEIYPARELPIAGVCAEMLLPKITAKKQLANKQNLMQILEKNNFEVLVTVGAGDIDTFIEKIKFHLLK